MSERTPDSANSMLRGRRGRRLLGCLFTAALLGSATGCTLSDSSDREPQPAVCYYEVPEDSRVWNVAADLSGDEFDVGQINDELIRDNPAETQDDFTVDAGDTLAVSSGEVCSANQGRFTEHK